jgi:hypothetical protein
MLRSLRSLQHDKITRVSFWRSPDKIGTTKNLREEGVEQWSHSIITSVKEYYVYITSNNSGTLYTGVTNDLERRVQQHKSQTIEGFTKQYSITRLLYFESTNDV